ncbi:MAG: type II toxin-antitoxin system VapC family toxin [Candidatus Baldrarchaeia archaeon]
MEVHDLCITFVTMYEYLRGSVLANRDPLEEKRLLEDAFEILWPDNQFVLKLSEIWAKLKKKGMLIDDRDLMIGVLSIVRDIPLCTFNKSHFSRLQEFNLKLIDIKDILAEVGGLPSTR